MSSLLFWGPVLAHKGYMSHKREKQRVKNYERWEGLRDEYDDQRRISRESRSLDIQRTGTWDPVTQQMTGYNSIDDNDRGILTLRDQQEANDARTGWRPQEAWESPRTQMQAQMTGRVQSIPQQEHTGYPTQHPQPQRHVSMTAAPTGQIYPHSTNHLPLKAQKTGVTWDEGLPAPLQVSRQSFDDYNYGRYGGSAPVSANVSRQSSVSRRESTHTPSGLRSSTPVSQAPINRHPTPPEVEVVSYQELPKNEFGFVDPTAARQTAIPGGRMAELIERGY